MRNEPISSPHLNETQILSYLDGELERAEREAAHKHLESCWTCRGLVNEIQGSIQAFMNARATVLPQESPFAEMRIEQFRQRLARHADSGAGESGMAAKASAWREKFSAAAAFLFSPRQAAIAGFLVATLLIVMFTDVLNTRVSADTLLTRADQYDSSHAPTTGKVNHVSLKVERISRKGRDIKALGTLAVLHDSATSGTYLDAVSANGDSSHAMIAANGRGGEEALRGMLSPEDAIVEQYLDTIQWTPDVSASAFKRLLTGEPGFKASAYKNDDGFAVNYQVTGAAAHGVTQALLQVAAGDFAPTGVSIFTGDQESGKEYRFTRTGFVQDERTPELAALFVPASPSPETRTASRDLPKMSKPVPVAYEHSRATEREVEVASSLHRSDACLGEEIYVFPMSDGNLLVQGIVDSAQRRSAIVQMLKADGVQARIEIYLPREIKDGSGLYGPPQSFRESVVPGPGPNINGALAEGSADKSPLYERLTQHFAKPGVSPEDAEKEVAVFSNEVVTLARQTFLHAWALKRLEGEFSEARTTGLSDSTLRKVDAMRRDHRRWIATLAKRESEMLTPLTNMQGAAQGLEQAKAGVVGTDALLHLAEQQSQLIGALFGSSQPAQATNAGLAQLLAVVRRMGS